MTNESTCICPDCKGSGIYQGLGAVEDCATCKGLKVMPHAQGVRRSAQLDLVPGGEPGMLVSRAVNVMTELKVGDAVYVFDAGWFFTVVDKFFITSKSQSMIVVSYGTGYVNGSIQMRTQSVCWNLTKDRWEYIRSGTPIC